MEEKVPKRITDEITLDLPRNWESRSLNELCKIKIGGTPKTNIKSFWNGSIKWATAKDISNTSGRFIQKTEKTITKEGSDRSAAKILPANTIVITARGTVGKMAITPEPMAINQTCYGLLVENIDNMFLYYSVKSAIEKLMGVSYGTVFDTITIKSFENIRLLVPNNRAEQRAIAKILSDLDSKIELNQKMNKSLESIAQDIFKHWFIDFEFPNDEGKPYKSSGGEMVDSELGEIPKGWDVTTVGKCVDISGGATPRTSDLRYWNGGTKYWATPKDLSDLSSPILINTDRKITVEGLISIGGRLFPKGSLLLSSRAPIGYLALTDIETSVNQGIIAMLPNGKLSPFYMYGWCKANMNIIKDNANGSTFAEISKSSFRSIKIILPTKRVLQLYDENFSKVYAKLTNNTIQSVVLSNIRDILLPRLMSGKIRVPLEE